MSIKRSVYHLSVIFCFLFISVPGKGNAWQDDTASTRLSRVKDLVSFLELTLNNIGGDRLLQKEKDIIITQSYTKFFRDGEVQIEDDLEPNRSTVTNKDVQAYLKDVDFFFKKASFKLEIEEIQEMVNDNNINFFLVKLNRNLNGITITGDTLNQTLTRFLEINYNDQDDDLKIVSYYTTKLSEEEDLLNWWDELTFEWKYILQNRVNFRDSIGFEELKALVSMDSLDLSSNHYVRDFEPLFKLDQLKYLNLSNTYISDLSPLRVHNKIEFLDISNTSVADLSYMKYAINMNHLNLSKMSLIDLGVLSNFIKLKHLDLSVSRIDSVENLLLPPSLGTLIFTEAEMDRYDWLENLINLKYLDLSFSSLDSIGPVSRLVNLNTLLLEGTDISDLSPLADFKALEVLNIESTKVADIYGLSQLPNLRKVYCDHSLVTKSQADSFMKEYPEILIIFESDELRVWWADLAREWKEVFMERLHLSQNPEKDDLAMITQMDSIDISGNKKISTLEGLAPLKKLRYLDFHNTFVVKVNTMTTLPELNYIDGSYSNITAIDSVGYLKNLTYLNLESTRISSLADLSRIRGLKFLNLDLTAVDQKAVVDLKYQNPECLIIFRTHYLKTWWDGLNEMWKEVFKQNAGINEEPERDDLHKITYLKSIKIDGFNIFDLQPLNELYFLNELNINRTGIKDLSPLKKNLALEKLTINQSPVIDISMIVQLSQLNYLDISNTGIGDIDILAGMPKLEVIKLSGIQIKDIKPLEDLTEIRQLDISNTRVKSLSPIEGMSDLEMLVCYNTRIKQKTLDTFRELHPDCQIVYY
ncbi:MAG: leucine-rich repeat domain-containing protein [Cyclobacteriaceae bacterium]|nr:leucine-rich repeat domain-containing protein [Cyclobacteriaceae bacterium]